MPVRTLHLINGLGTGGAERSLAELLPDLRDHDIDPQVAVFHRRHEGVEDEVRDAGIPVHHIDPTGWPARIRAVRRLIRQLEPDLLHTTIFEADVVGRIAAWREGVPVLTSLVNTSYEPSRLSDPNITRPRLRIAQAIDAATAHLGSVRFHAISGAVRDSASRTLRIPSGDVTVIPRGRRMERLGEPTPERRRMVRAQLGIPQDAAVVVHVGRQEHQKGHDILLRAMAPLMQEREDVHLVLAGRSGNATSTVHRLAGALPQERTHELGHVNDVPDLLAAADVFAFPSRYEGLGGAALEAMALGVPIVASDVPALRELLHGVGTLIPAEDVGALRDSIRASLADGSNERSRIGRQRFADHYDHEVVTRSMQELMRRTRRSQGTD